MRKVGNGVSSIAAGQTEFIRTAVARQRIVTAQAVDDVRSCTADNRIGAR
jgi:hypothetical protein